MNGEEIRKYAQLMKDLDLTSLSVTENGTTVRLKRPAKTQPAAGQIACAHSETINRTEPEEESISLTAPMVGVFYAAPAENADPFVQAGDKVKEGDVLCIIEAMKLMNEIRSEVNGTVEKICVTNGQVVEYGTELMRIRKG